MSEEFQYINFDNMRNCLLKRLLLKNSARGVVTRINEIERLGVSIDVDEENFFTVRFAKQIDNFETFSSKIANQLRFLLDYGGGYSKKIISSCKLKVSADPVTYDPKEFVLEKNSDTESLTLDIAALCNDFGGRVDMIRLCCGGETLRVQNSNGDLLDIPDDMSGVRFETVFRFLIMVQRDFVEENDLDVHNFAMILKQEYDEQKYHSWCDDDDDENPCKDSPCCQEESDSKDVDAKLCTICMDKKRDAVFQQCGHVCCCISCAKDMKSCPICQTMSKAIKIFNS